MPRRGRDLKTDLRDGAKLILSEAVILTALLVVAGVFSLAVSLLA